MYISLFMNRPEFETHIQKWVTLDNQIRSVNDKIKVLREEKNKVENSILRHIETNKMQNAVVSISDGKLKFTNSKQTSPITLGHVEECLSKCIANKEHVEKIMNYIKSTRPSKYVGDIKRSYNDNNS
jgi:hypothetical protein